VYHSFTCLRLSLVTYVHLSSTIIQALIQGDVPSVPPYFWNVKAFLNFCHLLNKILIDCVYAVIMLQKPEEYLKTIDKFIGEKATLRLY